jgi:hypothetical protein
MVNVKPSVIKRGGFFYMKYTIFSFQQEKLMKYNLDVLEALTLQVIKDMYSSMTMEYIVENDKRYIWIKSDKLVQEVPIVGSKRNVQRKVEKLELAGFIERIVKYEKKNKKGIVEKGSYSYYCLTEQIDELSEYSKNEDEQDKNENVEEKGYDNSVMGGYDRSVMGGYDRSVRGGMTDPSGGVRQIRHTKDPLTIDPPTIDNQSIYRSDQKEVDGLIGSTEKPVSKKEKPCMGKKEKEVTQENINQSINQSKSKQDHNKEKVYDENKKLIAENIDYEMLKQNNSLVEDILTVMAETMSSDKNFIRVGCEQKPLSFVKSILLGLDSRHILYVLDFLNEEKLAKVKNKKAYILTVLYKSHGVKFNADTGQKKKDENNSKNSSKEKSESYCEDKRAYDWYKQVIADSIEYDTIKHEDDMVENILELMTDVVTTKTDYIRVGKEEKPREVVKAVFLKLKSYHVQYVVDCMKNNTQKINNMKSYLTTALYNAPTTIESYYANQAQHDMYGA